MNIEQVEKILSSFDVSVLDSIDYDREYEGNCCYCILDTVTGLAYIGRTCGFKSRMVTHYVALRKGKHHCSGIQSGYDLGHRISSFIIERFGDEYLLSGACEVYWMGRFGERCCNKYRPEFSASLNCRSDFFLESIARFGFRIFGDYARSSDWEYKEKRSSKILKLLNAGHSRDFIAREVGIKPSNMSAWISYFKKRGTYKD